MQLSTGISFVALVVSIVTLVLVFQLFIWGRSEPPEPPKDNSLACAELLSTMAMVNWPNLANHSTATYEAAKDVAERTIEKIEADRNKLGC